MRFAKAGKLTDGRYFDVVVKAVKPLVSSNPGYISHFAYIRNGVSHTMYPGIPNKDKIRPGEAPGKNLHKMNSDPMNSQIHGTNGFMGQINMYSDAEKRVTETLFDFRYEVHNNGEPGELVDDDDMLFKMAFVDFDEDRRQSVTETFCVNLDQLDLDVITANVDDWDVDTHPSGEPRFFLPGFEQFGGENGDDLQVEIFNTTSCNGDVGASLHVTSLKVGFLCDNPEKYDEYFRARENKLNIPGWVDKKHCKDCFARKNAAKRCHGPKSWSVREDGSIEELLKTAGADWQYYPEHPTPSDYASCENCKNFDPPCYSVQKCQQIMMQSYNDPWVHPWKRSVMLAFKEPQFRVTYGVHCKNVGRKGKPYDDPRKETCDRNFQFTCSTWKQKCT